MDDDIHALKIKDDQPLGMTGILIGFVFSIAAWLLIARLIFWLWS